MPYTHCSAVEAPDSLNPCTISPVLVKCHARAHMISSPQFQVQSLMQCPQEHSHAGDTAVPSSHRVWCDQQLEAMTVTIWLQIAAVYGLKSNKFICRFDVVISMRLLFPLALAAHAEAVMGLRNLAPCPPKFGWADQTCCCALAVDCCAADAHGATETLQNEVGHSIK